jgi:putative ABC transport system ATP-binding protein
VKNFDLHLSNIKVTLPAVLGRPPRNLFEIKQLQIRYGQHLLIQGESGKGKTTFLHMLAGLFAPHEGSVQLGSVALNQLSDDACCELRCEVFGVIFQKLNLLDHLTVAENVSLTLGKDIANSQARINEAIHRVNLIGKEDSRCNYLSTGEQQRVAVARVLAQRPEIILADEPTSSLDAKNADFVIQALKESAKGRTLVVVSHDQRLIQHFNHVISFQEFTT